MSLRDYRVVAPTEGPPDSRVGCRWFVAWLVGWMISKCLVDDELAHDWLRNECTRA